MAKKDPIELDEELKAEIEAIVTQGIEVETDLGKVKLTRSQIYNRILEIGLNQFKKEHL